MNATTPPRCRNPRCGKLRTRRKDNRGWNGCHDWCSACTERWRVAGRPPEGPSVAPSGAERAARISAGLRRHHAAHGQSGAALAALAAHREEAASRRTDYVWLRSFGESREDAASRAGVSMWTARWEYDRQIAAMEASSA